MINFIVAIIVGALVGWIASMVMKTDAQQGACANVIVGVIGAALGSWLFGDVLGFAGADYAGTFSLAGLFWGILGAVILIAILKGLNVFK